MGASRSRLALPLAAVFVVCFVAPLFVLLVLSLHGDIAMTTWTAHNYLSFFTDRFSYSILIDTLLLGVKATLVCFIFGFPVAWLSARVGARWQSILLFLVILPILTSVVVRTFSWIVILGRYGVLNQIILGLGLSSEPLRLLYTEIGVVMVLVPVVMGQASVLFTFYPRSPRALGSISGSCWSWSLPGCGASSCWSRCGNGSAKIPDGRCRYNIR